MTNLLGSIRLAAYAFPLIAVLVAVPFFDRQVRARCFNWVRTVFGGLFLFYVLCVLALVFFPLPDAAQAARLSGHEIQLVPFQFVADFLRETPLVLSDARTYLPALFDRTVLQVVCNILMLLPFGMYLRYVCGLDLGKVALASLAFSAFIELGQLTGLFFVFRGSYRLCDVDDLMLNTLGGLLGGELVHALEAYLPPLDAFDEAGNVVGVVLPVGVDGQGVAEARLACGAEPAAQGVPLAAVAGVGDGADALRRGEHLGRAVRRAVVDHEDVGAVAPHAGDDPAQRPVVVVGGNHHGAAQPSGPFGPGYLHLGVRHAGRCMRL